MKQHSYRQLVWVWATLLMLLVLSFGSAYVHMGSGNAILNLVIAAAKTALVAIFFMHLKASGALLRLAAVTALFMLAVLFVLSGTDYATRQIYPAPWQAPVQGAVH